MKDEGLKSEINLGEVFEEDEAEISIIKGDLGVITLSLYPSEINFTTTLEIWFHKFVNLLEILLPPKLGGDVIGINSMQDSRKARFLRL